MDTLIAVLKDTPIPTILVISGIIFLFLALAGSVAGKLEMPPARQKWSAMVSFILLTAGMLLYITPGVPQSGVPQSSEAAPSATPLPVAATQPAAATQPVAPQAAQASASSDPAAAVRPSGAPGAGASEASDPGAGDLSEAGSADLEGCLAVFFTDIPAERITSLEVGAGGDLVTAPDQLSGVILEEFGQPVAALGFMFFEDGEIFKAIAAVDGTCEPAGVRNSSRGGAGDVLQNWDTLEVTTISGVYTLRFGYYAGEASVETGRIE